jgi:flagellar hook-associated protein 1 FlgK
MSGLTGAIDTALSGLQLYEAGIATVSNNLANATTTGYAVESVSAQTAVGSPGQPGIGVEAPQITQAATGFAATQLRNANTASSAASAQSAALTSLSGALTNNGDIQTALNQFFEDISTLAANPTSAAQRQTVLSDAQTVSNSFQSAAGTIQSTTAGAQTALTSGVSTANGLLQQLAALNKSLVQAPNDPALLDQQQAALTSLSQMLPVNTLPQSNGSVIVASGGTVLLDQSGVQSLAVTAQNTVTAGTNAVPVTLTSADGSIGGAVGTITAGGAALQSLDALAASVAAQVNTAQAEGLDANGNQGTALLSVPSPSVTAASGNTGSASVTASLTNTAAMPANGGPFTLAYSGGAWSATDIASGTSYAVSGTPPGFAGLTLGITGTPANGDRFTVNPAPGAALGLTVATTLTSAVAAADPYVGTPGTLQANGSFSDTNAGTINTGTDSVTSTPAANAAVVPASYYGQNLQVTFSSATAYTVSTVSNPGTAIASGTLGSTGGNIAVAYPAGAASGQYWQLPISGAPVAGDVLTLTPGGTTSGSNAQRMGALWTASGTTTSGSLEQAVVGLSTGLGANAQAAQNLAAATSAQVTTATSNLSTIAGVNTDHQAVILVNYQQAYQAAAQAISAAHTMFDSLLSAI